MKQEVYAMKKFSEIKLIFLFVTIGFLFFISGCVQGGDPNLTCDAQSGELCDYSYQ